MWGMPDNVATLRIDLDDVFQQLLSCPLVIQDFKATSHGRSFISLNEMYSILRIHHNRRKGKTRKTG